MLLCASQHNKPFKENKITIATISTLHSTLHSTSTTFKDTSIEHLGICTRDNLKQHKRVNCTNRQLVLVNLKFAQLKSFRPINCLKTIRKTFAEFVVLWMRLSRVFRPASRCMLPTRSILAHENARDGNVI